MKALRLVLFMLIGMLIGCSSKSVVTIEFQRPARFPLTQYKRIAVGSFNGGNGEEVKTAIQQALFMKGFKVLDRDRISEIEREGKTSAKAGVIIRGLVNELATTRPTLVEAGTAGNVSSGRLYKVYRYVAEGRASVTIKVTDATTEFVAPPQTYTGHAKAQTQMPAANPVMNIDLQGLKNLALQQVVSKFMKEIAPYKDRRDIVFYTSSTLPELEMGINAIGANNWDQAQDIFKQAAEKQIPEKKETAKAYYNLGVAQMYCSKYAEAKAALEKARNMGFVEANEQLAILPELANEQTMLEKQL